METGKLLGKRKTTASYVILFVFVVSTIAFVPARILPRISSASSQPLPPRPIGSIANRLSVTANSYADYSTNLLNSSTSTVTFDFNSTVYAVVLFTNSTMSAGYSGSWPAPASFVAYYIENASAITFKADLSQYYFAIFLLNTSSAFFSMTVDGNALQVSKVLGVSQLVSSGPDNSLQMSDGLVVNPLTCSEEGYTPVGSKWIDATGPAPTCGSGTQLQSLQVLVVTPQSLPAGLSLIANASSAYSPSVNFALPNSQTLLFVFAGGETGNYPFANSTLMVNGIPYAFNSSALAQGFFGPSQALTAAFEMIDAQAGFYNATVTSSGEGATVLTVIGVPENYLVSFNSTQGTTIPSITMPADSLNLYAASGVAGEVINSTGTVISYGNTSSGGYEGVEGYTYSNTVNVGTINTGPGSGANNVGLTVVGISSNTQSVSTTGTSSTTFSSTRSSTYANLSETQIQYNAEIPQYVFAGATFNYTLTEDPGQQSSIRFVINKVSTSTGTFQMTDTETNVPNVGTGSETGDYQFFNPPAALGVSPSYIRALNSGIYPASGLGVPFGFTEPPVSILNGVSVTTPAGTFVTDQVNLRGPGAGAGIITSATLWIDSHTGLLIKYTEYSSINGLVQSSLSYQLESTNALSHSSSSSLLLPVAGIVSVVAVISGVLLAMRRRGKKKMLTPETSGGDNSHAPSAVVPSAEVTSSVEKEKLQENKSQKNQQTSTTSPPASKPQVAACSSCGSPLLPGDTFCGKCGRRV
ncbi:MAG: zinc ribbon domain-containing protein [Nitrososphaerota archaeon]|nr:zinc ribbon domain-containing protein [Nitrososphaerota archaeon]